MAFGDEQGGQGEIGPWKQEIRARGAPLHRRGPYVYRGAERFGTKSGDSERSLCSEALLSPGRVVG